MGQAMSSRGYSFLVKLAEVFGAWFFILFARIIAAGYFCCSSRRKESCRFYGIVYPQKSRWHHLWCTFRQYQQFTTIHTDRFLLNHGRHCQLAYACPETMQQVFDPTGGAILLMSHMGNWEMAARLLMQTRDRRRLLLYMGVKEKEGVERRQKEELQQAGVTIIGVEQASSSPLAAVAGINHLREGGIVSMTGDVLWRAGQKRVAVSILGHQAYVAEAPFVFALVSGAPIYVFFAFRQGANRYFLSFSLPLVLTAPDRAGRRQAIDAAAQGYADLLERVILEHPQEWYHFDRFLHEPLELSCEGH